MFVRACCVCACVRACRVCVHRRVTFVSVCVCECVCLSLVCVCVSLVCVCVIGVCVCVVRGYTCVCECVCVSVCVRWFVFSKDCLTTYHSHTPPPFFFWSCFLPPPFPSSTARFYVKNMGGASRLLPLVFFFLLAQCLQTGTDVWVMVWTSKPGSYDIYLTQNQV